MTGSSPRQWAFVVWGHPTTFLSGPVLTSCERM
jgi:hypothetical protein